MTATAATNLSTLHGADPENNTPDTEPTDYRDILGTGKVIQMRHRLWRVDRIEKADWERPIHENKPAVEFAATPLDGSDTISTRFFLPLEDVTSGKMPLPDPDISTSDPVTQQQILDAYRLSLIHGSAPLLGLQRSRAVPTEFQLIPLLKILGKDRVRLLIADDVGTGKTVEAGLIMAELFARALIRKVLIVVPASLREQWKEALEHFFHLQPIIVARHLLPALERQLLPGQSVWESHNVIIASVDYLKTRTQHVLEHDWDLVIIDEAHLVSKPHTGKSVDSRMQRWQFARQAAQKARHLILLTATPHNGYFDTWASLFYMLDPSLINKDAYTLFDSLDSKYGKTWRKPRIGVEDLSRKDIKIDTDRALGHVVQRRRQDIEKWYEEYGKTETPFPARDQDEDIIPPSNELRNMLSAISRYTTALFRSMDEPGGSRDTHLNGWIATHLQKRALSSPEALRKSLRNRIRGLSDRQRTKTGPEEEAEDTQTQISEIRQDIGDQAAGDDAKQEEGSATDHTRSTLDIGSEQSLIQQAMEAAERVTVAKDSKIQKLFELLGHPQIGRLHKHRNKARVIVFTRYKDTLDYLVASLEKESKKKTSYLPDKLQVFTISGEMSLVDRQKVFKNFERSQPAVLVATDCISEGLNLQIHCAELIHYEIPWNPNRLEQRNGRVDRYGQPEDKVGIRLLVIDTRLDQLLLKRIVRKARQMFLDQGFVPSFLANPDILYHLSQHAGDSELQQPQLGLGEIDEVFREFNDNVIPDDLKPFYGQDEVSFGEVGKALERTREAVGGPETLRRFLDRGLRKFNMHRVKDPQDERIWKLSKPTQEFNEILSEQADESFTLCPQLGLENPDVDVVDLSHPLIHRLVDVVRRDSQKIDYEGRVGGFATKGVDIVTAVVQVLARYVAVVENQTVLMEELLPVRMPVWGDKELAAEVELKIPDEHVEANLTTDRIREACRDLFKRSDFTPRVEAAVEEHRVALGQRHEGIVGSWARNLDQVETASQDVVSVTIHFPPAASQ